MEIKVTFTNWQVFKGKIQIESKLESVGVYANGLESESVAIALMAAIDCLVIESKEVVEQMLRKLPAREQNGILRVIASEVNGREIDNAAM